MAVKMQARSVTIDELTTPPANIPSWWSKEGTTISIPSGISGFILPTGGTPGVINAQLLGDNNYRLIPIVEADVLQPLPHIHRIDLTGTTAGITTILLGEY